MIRRALVPALLLITAQLAAQTPVEQRAETNNERGFVAEKAYQFDGLGSVNLFNGNLTLTLPIGGTYPVSASLGYSLKLYYNSKVWEQVLGGGGACPNQQNDDFAAFPARFPHHAASAGLGWTFSLGHIVPRTHASASGNDVYVSPDGATHHFKPRESATVAGYSHVAYTKDGTHLRLKVTNTTPETYELEFPDGTIHKFGSDGLIVSMEDRFAKSVLITYSVVAGDWVWTLTDAHRTQTITFRDAWTELDPTKRFETLRWVLKSVSLAAFSSDGTSSPVGTYSFDYSFDEIDRGCTGGFNYWPCTSRPEVPLLTGMTQPDGSTFGFQYYTSGGSSCEQGALKRVTLPTGGVIAWAYGTYYLPANGCGDNFGGDDWRNTTPGVISKIVYDTDGTTELAGTWTWQPGRSPLVETANVCADDTLPGGTLPVQIKHKGYQHVTNTFTDPLGRATVHYFASWDSDGASTTGNFEADYGLPYTRQTTAPGAPGRYLSRKECTGTAIDGCTPLRTIYVAYDHTLGQIPPPATSERTVFNDDEVSPTEDHYTDSAMSEYDGLGHFRKTIVDSSFGPKRTTFVAYNGASGTAVVDQEDPWLLNRYDRETVTQTVDGVDTTVETQVCMDATTGALTGKRWLKGSTIANTDVVVRYERDAGGDAVAEDWYGGDETPLESDDLCDAEDAGTSEYRIEHTYTAGVRQTSTYRNATFKSFDAAVDARTGLARAETDAAGAGTKYDYDAQGRIVSIKAEDEVWTHYEYDLAARPALVIVRTFEPTIVNPANATSLTERRIYYDAAGRMLQARERMPASKWSVVNYIYNMNGQLLGVSSPALRDGGAFESGFAPAHFTTFTYDRYGRPRITTTPDDQVLANLYTGAREVLRLGGRGAVFEAYDAHGRLSGVTEYVDDENTVVTTYKHDVANRLTNVTMEAGALSQSRSFTYDGRGFLTSETHPEKGSTGNGSVTYMDHDSRGRALRVIDGAQNGPFDLTMTYDFAGRLTKIEDLSPSGARRTLKAFSYASENAPVGCTPGDTGCNATKGKLVTATRNHYLAGLGTIPVVETYSYGGIGGRPTKRDTTVGDTASFSGASFSVEQTWNAQGLLATLGYPTTTPVTVPRAINYTYSEGLLTGVTGYAAITYQASRLVDKITHSNGAAEEWIADPHGMARPRRIEVTLNGGTQPEWLYGDFAYNALGSITAIGSWSYGYDGLNRLVSWTLTGATSTATTRRKLDGFGNPVRTEFESCVTAGLGDCFVTSLKAAVNSATNRLVADSHDAAGNVTSDGTTTYGYDGSGSMVSLTGAGQSLRYLYTADDERLAILDLTGNKTIWTVRGTNNQLLRTFTRAGFAASSAWSWTEDEIWRGTQILASESPSGRKHYHLDHLGSPRFVTNSAGARLGEQTYTPFGIGGTADGGRIQFTGHEADANGLIYAHARYLGGGRGRFLSVDPVLDVKRALLSPQMWNRYAYVMNNPINRIDPDGRLVQMVGTEEERQKAFEILKSTLRTQDQKHVSMNAKGVVSVAGKAKGGIALMMLKDLARKDVPTINVQLGKTVTMKTGPGPSPLKTQDLQAGGGGITVSPLVSRSGNLEVHVDPRGSLRIGSPALAVMAHELMGHAWDLLFTGTSSERTAVNTENNILLQLGQKPYQAVPKF
jgi:RHS repeat-associated protein